MTGREQRRLPDAGPAIDAYRAGLAAHKKGREQVRCSCGKPFPEDGGTEGVCECCSGCAEGRKQDWIDRMDAWAIRWGLRVTVAFFLLALVNLVTPL